VLASGEKEAHKHPFAHENGESRTENPALRNRENPRAAFPASQNKRKENKTYIHI